MLYLNGKCDKGILSTRVRKPAVYWKVLEKQDFRSQVCEGGRFFFLCFEIYISWVSLAMRALQCSWRMTVFRKCIVD